MSCACNIKTPIQTIAIDLSVTSIGSSSWVQLLADLVYAAGSVEIFNGSSSAFSLAMGASGSEVTLPYTIIPGGTDGIIALSQIFKTGSRISAKSIGGTPTQGLLIFNFYG